MAARREGRSATKIKSRADDLVDLGKTEFALERHHYVGTWGEAQQEK